MSATETTLSRPIAETGGFPRIAVAIQHVESRAHLLPRLYEALGAPPLPLPGEWAAFGVVTGDEAKRDPWTTYMDCLSFAEICADGADATHLVIVQDDALLVPSFYERLLDHVAERPLDVLCCYVPNQPAYMARVVHQAFSAGRRFADLPGGMFVPLVCTCWPVATAADCLIWEEGQATARQRRCDDAQVARYLARRKQFAVGIVPSLADHDELTPSTLGLGRYRRHAAIVAPAAYTPRP